MHLCIKRSTLEKVRGILNNLKTNKDPNIRRLGGVAVTQADNFISLKASVQVSGVRYFTLTLLSFSSNVLLVGKY